MRMYDIIAKKRDGGELSRQEISFFVKGCSSGKIPDEQTSALLMAIFIRGMSACETDALTMEMAYSGQVQELSGFLRTVDKHSTGGVGDKTSLIVAPLAAANGCVVAKMSGRGLGHTGGTIDKLESIPGFRASLSPAQLKKQLSEIGIAIAGQSEELAPADKKLYAIRDVTATIESIPLIASSIMSKKIAAGAESIVLDVKTGRGAFMKSVEESRALAREMIRIGKSFGKKMAALITDMDVPLGCAVGNALEVDEAISVLKGQGPADLVDVCLCLAAHMISLSWNIPLSEARDMAQRSIYDASGLQKLRELIAYQGGDASVVDSPELLPQARIKEDVTSERSGFISSMDALCIGNAALLLGAGRTRKEDTVDFSAGILLLAKPGEYIERGQPIARLHCNDASAIEEARRRVLDAVSISDGAPARRPLVAEVLCG